MDRTVELTSLGAKVHGGGYDLYAERRAAEAAAAERELIGAELALAHAERDIQAKRERKAKRDGAGRRSRAKGDAPKMLLDARAQRAEATGGRLNRLGELEPSAGRIVRGVKAAMLDQRIAILDDGESLLANFRRLNPEAGDNAAHAALACVLMAERPPQLVILDEPTNHLDLDSIAAVEEALADYDGALVVASHDQDFLAAVRADRRIELGR